MAAAKPISPKASWVTDQQLNPWDEPKHYVLNGDLTKPEPVKKGTDPTEKVTTKAASSKAAPSTVGAAKK